MTLLQGKVIMVTGASEGIGRAMVKLFASEGALVGAVARRHEALAALAAEVGPDRVLPLPADVRKLADLEAAAAMLVERWGRVDALVNNAGVAKYIELTEMEPKDWQWQLDVNLTGVFNACKAVVPLLKKQAAQSQARVAAQVLNISSILGTVGRPGGTAYCATKWGIMGFTESLRMELNKERIRVMVLCPGLTQTDFAGIAAAAKEAGLRPESVALQALHMLAAPPDAYPTTMLLRPFA